MQLRTLEVLGHLTCKTDTGIALVSICTRQTFQLLLQINVTMDNSWASRPRP